MILNLEALFENAKLDIFQKYEVVCSQVPLQYNDGR